MSTKSKKEDLPEPEQEPLEPEPSFFVAGSATEQKAKSTKANSTKSNQSLFTGADLTDLYRAIRDLAQDASSTENRMAAAKGTLDMIAVRLADLGLQPPD